MRVYLLQRLAAMILTLLGVSLLIFAMIRLVPGTVVEQLLGQAAIASPEVLAAFRRFFGLDRPAHVQSLDWLAAVLRGDFGVSWLSGRPVLALFLERVPVSAELAVLAVAWSLVIGIPLGTASAVWRGGVRDGVIRVIATLGLSLPAFWQGARVVPPFSVLPRRVAAPREKKDQTGPPPKAGRGGTEPERQPPELTPQQNSHAG